MKNAMNYWENIYRVLIITTLIYIGYELHSLKQLTKENEEEINYVTSKLDYVTSDINIQKVSHYHSK